MNDKRKVEVALDALYVAIEYIEAVLGSDAEDSETLKFLRNRRDLLEEEDK